MPEALERGGATLPGALERGGATVFEPRPGLGDDVRLETQTDSVRLMPLGAQGITGDRVMGILNALLWFTWLTKHKVEVVYSSLEIFPTDTLQQKIEITDLTPFLAADNTSVLIILATAVNKTNKYRFGQTSTLI